MKLIASLAMRLIPAAAGAGFSLANLHTVVGTATAVLTALYTAFITLETAKLSGTPAQPPCSAQPSSTSRADLQI